MLLNVVEVIRRLLAVVAFGFALLGGPGLGIADEDAADYAFVQKPGSSLPLDAVVMDQDGHSARIGDLLKGRPSILALGYFHCPNLCTVVRDDLFEALSRSGLQAATDYTLVVMSIDPTETTADAVAAFADDKARYPLTGSEVGWHFVTGDAATIAAVSQAVGFRSRYDVHLRQFLHPAGIVIATPQGRVSGYVLGVGYGAGDLRAAVTLASSGGLARAAMPILLLCFHYDEATGRYSLAVMKVLRLAGIVTIMVIGGTVLLLRRRAGEGRPS